MNNDSSPQPAARQSRDDELLRSCSRCSLQFVDSLKVPTGHCPHCQYENGGDAPRHGLPDVYPDNEPGFRAIQAQHATWVEFVGPTEQTIEVVLQPGQQYEMWPAGSLFNASGTYLGELRRCKGRSQPMRDRTLQRGKSRAS